MLASLKQRAICALQLLLKGASLRAARVRVPPQGPPNPGRVNGQGIMGRGNGRGAGPGRGRGGPDMMNAGPVNMPTPGFFGDMGAMSAMNGMGAMGPMGPNPMMMGMDMNYGRMGGFDGDFGMPGIASMGMGMNPMAHPMMMGMGDMGVGFPMAMAPPRPPPPRRPPVDERPGPAARPYSSDRLYDDDHVDDYRDPPARSGYSRYCKGSWQHHDSSSTSLAAILPGSPVFYAMT